MIYFPDSGVFSITYKQLHYFTPIYWLIEKLMVKKAEFAYHHHTLYRYYCFQLLTYSRRKRRRFRVHD